MTATEHIELQDENRILNICTRIPAAFSMLCSGYIVYSVLSNHQKRSSPTQRIVLGMSCSDVVFSFFWFLASWPIPRGTPDAYGAVGNTQTCTMQGFFVLLQGAMTPMYNGFLALYCFLFVCRDWDKRRMNRVEVYGHVVAFIIPLAMAILCLALEMFNSLQVVCFIGPYPADCTQSYESIDGTTDCERGDNAFIYQFALFWSVLWANIIWSCFAMVKVYRFVRTQEKKMEAYTSEYSEKTTTSRRSDSRDVAIRGALFTGAFLATFLPATIAHGLELFGIESFHAHAVAYVLVPSQGIFNFVVYILHPAVSRHFRESGEKKKNVARTQPMTSEQSNCEQDAKHEHDGKSGKDKQDLEED